MKFTRCCSVPCSPLDKAAMAIGVITLVSGASQVAAPKMVLKLVGAETTPTSQHVFGTVGMFMSIAGGLLTHSMLGAHRDARILLWSVAQKACAVGAVALGVQRGVFARRALAVAAFDALSTIVLAAGLAASLWRRPDQEHAR